LITLGFFSVIIIFVSKGDGNSQASLLLVGALIASFTTIVQWFFGSSSGSAEKTALLKPED
jgi:ABC-type transport system involved in multi-copper enzyme maturation permease subunit